MKCRGHPKKSWVAQVGSLKKELDLQDKALNVKLLRKALDRREHEEFKVVLQHKSKLHLYRKLKWEKGPEEYLEFVKGALPDYLKFCSGTHWVV